MPGDAEPKQRGGKAPSACSRGTADVGADEDAGGGADVDAKLKGNSLAAWFPGLHRRRDDIFMMAWYFASLIAVHACATQVLLDPLLSTTMPEVDRLVLKFGGPIYYLLFALVNLSWLGVVFYGPGRVPPQPKANGPPQQAMPPALAEALQVGQFCKRRPFGASSEWCGGCDAWKPALAHHCSICGSCGLWMDSHCHCVGTCVGFRNLRCFIVWLCYCHSLAFAITCLTVRRLVLAFPESVWGAACWAAWAYVVHLNWNTVRMFVTQTMTRLVRGWPSQILLDRFKALLAEAKEVETELLEWLGAHTALMKDARDAHVATKAAVEELQQARAALQREDVVLGLFAQPRQVGVLMLALGAPPSWRCLLPLVPGGWGDPLAPECCNVEACEAWASLGSALRRCDEAADLRRQADAGWEQRVRQQMVHAGCCAGGCAGGRARLGGPAGDMTAPAPQTMPMSGP